MSLRNAIDQSRILTFVLLGIGLWLLIALFSVWSTMDNPWEVTGSYVGPNPIGGIIGIVVMAATLILLVVLYSALETEGPAPSAWPPEE